MDKPRLPPLSPPSKKSDINISPFRRRQEIQANGAAFTKQAPARDRLLDRKSWQAILFLRRREDKAAREVVREDDDKGAEL